MRYFKHDAMTEAIVVALDMRSSSLILDDVVVTKNWGRLIDFIGTLKHFLADELQVARGLKFAPHKFSGDAWLLFFYTNTRGADILAALRDISECYDREFDRLLRPILTSIPETTGMAFGIDVGRLYKLTIFGSKEYLSPAINVAARLQSAAKLLPSRFGTLVSRRVYEEYFSDASGFAAISTTRDLTGIRNGDNFPCVTVDLFSNGKDPVTDSISGTV
jgi:class 3 adenylate cyclase